MGGELVITARGEGALQLKPQPSSMRLTYITKDNRASLRLIPRQQCAWTAICRSSQGWLLYKGRTQTPTDQCRTRSSCCRSFAIPHSYQTQSC